MSCVTKKPGSGWLLAVILSILQISCNSGRENWNSLDKKDGIIVFAAAGSRIVMEELASSFTDSTGIPVECNFASSGTLARQIQGGAAADIFVSANSQWMDFLFESSEMKDSSLKILAGNKLVIIAPCNSPDFHPAFHSDFDISGTVKHAVAIGDPSFVPAGKYAKQFLDSLQWFEELKDRLVLAKDVSSVLRYVEMNECDWGIVYHSEAIRSEKVLIIAEVPDSLHEKIDFFIAETVHSNRQADSLINWLTGDTAKMTFLRYGFTGY